VQRLVVGDGDGTSGEALEALRDGLRAGAGLLGLGNDHDGVRGELCAPFVTLGQGFQEQGAGLGMLAQRGCGNHELVGLVDHLLPALGRLVVA